MKNAEVSIKSRKAPLAVSVLQRSSPTIRFITELVHNVDGMRQDVMSDTIKSYDAPQTLLDVHRLGALGLAVCTPLVHGISVDYADF